MYTYTPVLSHAMIRVISWLEYIVPEAMNIDSSFFGEVLENCVTFCDTV